MDNREKRQRKEMAILEINWKFFGYQILAIFVIWAGMTFFYNDLKPSGVFIYYVVTSWLLFLIVLGIRFYLQERADKQEEQEDDE